jgi:hypothetical protein
MVLEGMEQSLNFLLVEPLTLSANCAPTHSSHYSATTGPNIIKLHRSLLHQPSHYPSDMAVSGGVSDDFLFDLLEGSENSE